MFTLPRLSYATTAPVVGEIVSEPSAFETDETAPPPLPVTHTPLIAKQPVERLIPFANVEDADDEVTLSAVVWMPAPNVEVADPKMEVVEVRPTCSPSYADTAVVDA